MDTGHLLLAGEAFAVGSDVVLQQCNQSLIGAVHAGDDSSWNMSDWQWDANAFVAVPKLEQQSTSGCCKRQKTVDMLGPDRQSRPCGGCKAIKHEPLKCLLPAGDSAGSNSCDGRSEAKHEDLVSFPVQAVIALRAMLLRAILLFLSAAF